MPSRNTKKKDTKYVLVSGGVLSGLGKGVVASSTGRLLKLLGFSVTSIKIDPYINIDAGTMSPFEHGEVFVLEDGGEADLDLGNYERFMDITLSKDNNITTGKIYHRVIEKERKGEYLGKTVQVIPHVVDEIQDWIQRVAERANVDVCIIELGGTIGDIESMPFVEALRQFQFNVGKNMFCNIHVSLVPVMGSEQKTKPTQATVRQLRMLGLSPDIIVCRAEKPIDDSTKRKISAFCQVPADHVMGCHNVPNIYHVALLLAEQNIDKVIMQTLNIEAPNNIMSIGDNLDSWKALVQKCDTLSSLDDKDSVSIAFIGKYTDFKDSYTSVIKAVQHASMEVGVKTKELWVEAEFLHDKSSPDYQKSWDILKQADGVIVLGGFGDRGVEGKILGAKYCREEKVPMLGICLGMQVAVIEYARNVLGLKDANSEEFDPDTAHKAVIFMLEYTKDGKMGGSMRLGARETFLKTKDCMTYNLYGKPESMTITERHRHRYEVNPDMVSDLEKHGLIFVGQDDSGQRQEIIELKDHPFYLGTQYHPEFTSRPSNPNPCFVGLVQAAKNARDNVSTPNDVSLDGDSLFGIQKI